METVLHDLRHGIKLLWKDRGFAAAALVTLTLCIGANAAIFSVVHSVILAPLPFSQAERLVRVFNAYPNAGAPRAANGVPDYYDRRAQVEAFEELALFDTVGWTLGNAPGGPQRILGMGVTPSLFRLLETRPQIGRIFSEEESEVGREHSVILSHELWQEAFAGREDALGQDLRLSGEAYRIVGVLSEGFSFVDPDVRLWTPYAFTDQQRSDDSRHSNSWQMVGRLAPGATLGQAQAQIDAVNALNMERFPHFREPLLNAGFHTAVVPFQADLVRDVRGTLFLLWGGVLFVLLIGCVNIANLALVRASGRLKELSIRSALGAGRRRVTRQLVTESLVLAGLGGVLGLIFGSFALKALPALGLDAFPRSTEIAMGSSVVLATVGLVALVGLVLGLLPAMQLRKSDPYGALREEGRSGTTSRSTRRLRQGLVVAQVAFAFLLLIGAGLLLASFRRVLAVDPGFQPRGVLTATFSLPATRYADEADLLAFNERVMRAVGSIPGVEKAGGTVNIPFGGSYSDSVIFAEGYEMAPGESVVSPTRAIVTPGYFEALAIPLQKGRFFDHRDTADSRKVVIVDQRLAKRFWPDQDPLGKRMFLPSNVENLMDPGPEEDRMTVVGVVDEIKMRSRVTAAEPVGVYYFPYSQSPRRWMTLTLKTAGAPEALAGTLRREVAALDPELALFAVQPMQDRLDEDLVSRRASMLLALVFAALALLLAGVGLYGTLAYLVTQRSRELGIRLALGSTASRLFRLVLGEGLAILAVGLALGLAGAIGLGKALESELYGVGALDFGVLAQVALVLAGVSLLACWLPAARAGRTDPATVLTLD